MAIPFSHIAKDRKSFNYAKLAEDTRLLITTISDIHVIKNHRQHQMKMLQTLQSEVLEISLESLIFSIRKYRPVAHRSNEYKVVIRHSRVQEKDAIGVPFNACRLIGLHTRINTDSRFKVYP